MAKVVKYCPTCRANRETAIRSSGTGLRKGLYNVCNKCGHVFGTSAMPSTWRQPNR